MATVSFAVPTAPPIVYYGKKSGDGLLGLLLNLVVFAALIGLVWWFYQAMKKNAGTAKPDAAMADTQAPPPAQDQTAPPPDQDQTAVPPPEPAAAGPPETGAAVE